MTRAKSTCASSRTCTTTMVPCGTRVPTVSRKSRTHALEMLGASTQRALRSVVVAALLCLFVCSAVCLSDGSLVVDWIVVCCLSFVVCRSGSCCSCCCLLLLSFVVFCCLLLLLFLLFLLFVVVVCCCCCYCCCCCCCCCCSM